MKPNLLLIVVDCARAEKTVADFPLASPGTRKSAALPNWNRLRALGRTWTGLHAVSSTTTPNFASIFTGRLPVDHGIREHSRCLLSPGVATLAERFRDEGYATFAEVTGPLLPETGLARGFDEYRCRDRAEYLHEGFLARAERWLTRLPRPWFACLHLWEAHLPYQNPPPFDQPEVGVTPYDRALAYVDWALGQLLACVDLSNTVVVLCGDHGERLREDYALDRALGGNAHDVLDAWDEFSATQTATFDYDGWFNFAVERLGAETARIHAHNALGHGFHLTDDLIRVPLTIVAPWRCHPNSQTSEFRSQLDLFATLLNLVEVGVEPSAVPASHSLLDRVPAEPIYFEANGSGGKKFQSRCYLRGARLGRWKYWRMEAPDVELHRLCDIERDPRETLDCAACEPEVCRRFDLFLDHYLKRDRRPDVPIDPVAASAVETRLRALGYVA